MQREPELAAAVVGVEVAVDVLVAEFAGPQLLEPGGLACVGWPCWWRSYGSYRQVGAPMERPWTSRAESP